MGISFGDIFGAASSAGPDIVSEGIQAGRAKRDAEKAAKKAAAFGPTGILDEEEAPAATENEKDRRRRLAIATVATTPRGTGRPTTARARLLGA